MADSLRPQTTEKPGTEAPFADAIQGVTGGVPIAISGSIASTTTAKATAAAPTYVEGTDSPISQDLTGNLRTLATATTVAKATAADPTYTEGTNNPISQDLSGHLRTQLASGAATAAKQDTGNTSLSSIDGKVATETTLALIKAKTDNLDVTLSGGSQKAISRGGAKGATAAADITSTANGADHQGLDVQLQNATVAVTESGTWTVQQGTTPGSNAGAWWAQIGDTANGPAAVKAASTAAVAADKALVVAVSPNNTLADNVTQFGGTNISTGTGVGGAGIPRVTVSNDSAVKLWDGTNTAAVKAASTAAAAADPSAVVALSPNSPLPTGANTIGSVNDLPPTLTKGTQGSTGFSTQDLKDAGRVWKSYAAVATPTTTDTILTLQPTSDGTAGSTATSFTVTSGKRLRIQAFVCVTNNAGAAGQGVVANLRASASGAVTATSPLVAAIAAGTLLAVANIAASGVVVFPDGFELSGTMQFGVSWFGTNTAGGRVTITGYEY